MFVFCPYLGRWVENGWVHQLDSSVWKNSFPLENQCRVRSFKGCFGEWIFWMEAASQMELSLPRAWNSTTHKPTTLPLGPLRNGKRGSGLRQMCRLQMFREWNWWNCPGWSGFFWVKWPQRTGRCETESDVLFAKVHGNMHIPFHSLLARQSTLPIIWFRLRRKLRIACRYTPIN